jgi:hypothetical protein
MRRRLIRLLIPAAAAVLFASTMSPAAQAEDFLSALFGAFGARPPPSAAPLSFANEGDLRAGVRSRPGYSAGSQAYCVRTCDGPHQRLEQPEPCHLVQ